MNMRVFLVSIKHITTAPSLPLSGLGPRLRSAAGASRYAVKKEYDKAALNHESQGSDSNARIRRLVSS